MRRPTTNAWKKGKESERRKRFWKSDGKDRDSTSRSAISFSLRFAGRVLFHLNSSFFSHSFMSFARLRFSLLTSWSSFYSLLLYLCFRREEKEDKLTHDSRVVRKQSLARVWKFFHPDVKTIKRAERRIQGLGFSMSWPMSSSANLFLMSLQG